MTNREEYEKCFKIFDPKKFDADEWASIATMAGMKYAVYVCKHHAGFCMWDTETTDINIMNTPLKRDVTGEFAQACRRQGITFGTYLSIMDIHEAGWNRCYPSQADMPGYPEGIPHIQDFIGRQSVELIAKYDPDIMWYDGQWLEGWDKKNAATLYAKIKKAKPSIITCRIESRPPLAPDGSFDYENAVGDYHSMEARVGGYMKTPWEVATSVAYPNYSYNTNLTYKSEAEIIQMLSRIVCGNGNLLLSFIPDVDGAIPEVQKVIAKGIGNWVNANCEAIYGTRGGPWYPASWGGSTHKRNKAYVYALPGAPKPLRLPACPAKVLSACVLSSGKAIKYDQNEKSLDLFLTDSVLDPKATVVELVMDKEIEGMIAERELLSIFEGNSDYGTIISEDATLTLSTTSKHDKASNHKNFFSDKYGSVDYAFCTDLETNPSAIVDLGQVKRVTGIAIENRESCSSRAATLSVSISEDAKTWKHVWSAAGDQSRWEFALTDFHDAGGKNPGKSVRYIKLETNPEKPDMLHLRKIEVYGF